MKTTLLKIIVPLLLLSIGLNTKAQHTDTVRPVIAYSGAENLFEDSKLSKSVATLVLGTELVILKTENDLLNVRTSAGQQGWTRRCWICSLAEFKRRNSNDETPKNLVCVQSEGGKKFLYGGTLSIQNNRPAVRVGDAFWLDQTMKGLDYSIAGVTIVGDPSILFLWKGEGKIATLSIWTNNPDNATAIANHRLLKRLLARDVAADAKQPDVKLLNDRAFSVTIDSNGNRTTKVNDIQWRVAIPDGVKVLRLHFADCEAVQIVLSEGEKELWKNSTGRYEKLVASPEIRLIEGSSRNLLITVKPKATAFSASGVSEILVFEPIEERPK